MSEPELGPIADHVVFENERVRIWEMTLEPGESSAFHEHTLDYIICVIEGESIDADFAGGQSIQIPVEPGKVIYVPKGNRETAVNRSGVRYYELLVEIKDPAS